MIKDGQNIITYVFSNKEMALTGTWVVIVMDDSLCCKNCMWALYFASVGVCMLFMLELIEQIESVTQRGVCVNFSYLSITSFRFGTNFF